MDISSGKRWRTEEKVSILRKPELSSGTFEHSWDIQEAQSILHCKTMYCYQKVSQSFLSRRKRKRIEVNSESWFDPGGVSLRTGRQAVFFTVVIPMDNQDGSRIAPYENTWKHFQDTIFWCNLKLAQQRGLQFYQTRSNAVILYDTLPAEFSENAICMKTKDQLYQRESVILRPRVVHKANSQKLFTRSTCTGSKIILGIATRCGELRGNPKQHC